MLDDGAELARDREGPPLEVARLPGLSRLAVARHEHHAPRRGELDAALLENKRLRGEVPQE